MAKPEKPLAKPARGEEALARQREEGEAKRQAFLASLSPRDRERLAFPGE